jgi:hypothetical protein
MKTYLWYISATSRVIATGDHQHAAFLTLDDSDRQKIRLPEFCVEVDTTKDEHKAPYSTLLELRRPRAGHEVTYKSGSGRLIKAIVVKVEGNLCWVKYDGKDEAQPFIWRFKEGLNTLHDWPTKHTAGATK